MLKRGIVVGVAGAAMVVAACAGCSSNKSNTGASSSSAPAGPQVIVDGQNQTVSGQITCTQAGANTTIGIGDPTAGVGAVVSNDNPPIVHSVGLGSVNGISLGFSDAAPNNQGSNAGAAVTGKTSDWLGLRTLVTGVTLARTNPGSAWRVISFLT